MKNNSKRILAIKGRLIEFEGNKLVRMLPPEEEIEAKRKSSPQYQSSQFSNEELLVRFVDLLLKEIWLNDNSKHHVKAMAYMTEILWRMNKHK